MRREWSQFIRHRQWGEIEKIAKSEPNQALADTVGELVQGFSEKADKRALKKILYILQQAGYEPSEPEFDQSSEQAPEANGAYRRAFMVAADHNGDSNIVYGYEENGRVRWLTATVNENQGIVDASEEGCRLEDADKVFDTWLQAYEKDFFVAEVDPDYAISRVARAMGKSKSFPGVIPYWRRQIEVHPTEVEHPTAKKKVKTFPSEERRKVALEVDHSLLWRLELGAASPVLMELYEEDKSNGELSTDQKRERYESVTAKVCEQVFSDIVIQDHAMRLRDLAFLLFLKGDPLADLVLDAAIDLERNGPKSDYARGVLDKTVVVLLETWRRRVKENDEAQV